MIQANPSTVNSAPVRYRLDGWAGGVRVRLESDRPLGELPPELMAGVEGERSIAEITCQVRASGEVPGEGDRRFEWRWDEAGTQVRAGSARGQIRKRAARRYEAEVEASSALPFHLMPLVAHPVLFAEAGVVLHAAGAEIDGRVVLFVGPSGAGKSTAVSLLPGARLFTVDRAAVFSDEAGWWVGALPGGTWSTGNAASALRCAPIAGVLRVVQGRDEPSVRSVSATDALVILRSSAMAPEGDPSREAQLLTMLAELAEAVPVGLATTVLGRPFERELRDWLREREESHA